MRTLIPRKSVSKDVQKEHVRVIQTRHGTRPLLINQGVGQKAARILGIKPRLARRVDERTDGAPLVRLKPLQREVFEVEEEVKKLTGIEDHLREQAIFYYFMQALNDFKSWSDDDIKALSLEISNISLGVPLYVGVDVFKKGEIKRLLESSDFKGLKFVSANVDNEFLIKGMSKSYTPLYLYAVMIYGIDRLSGGQVVEKVGFEYLRLAKRMAGMEGKP